MAKKKVIKQSINFQIRAVELLNSHLQPTTKPFPVNQIFRFNIALEQKLNSNNKSLVVVTNVDISTNENLDFKLASASVACIYAVENFDEVVKIGKNKHIDIDQSFVDTLNSISISTTRGVLSQIFKGTVLHNAILPVIIPNSLKKVI